MEAPMLASSVLALWTLIEDPRGFDGAPEVSAAAPTEDGEDPTPVPATPASEPTASAPAETRPSTVAPQAATATAATTHTSDGAAKTAPKRYAYPRLVIAGGPVVGPHAFGSEECREQEMRCETTGTFFGVGANLELRAQIWRPLYLHVRGVIVANGAPRNRDPVYKGLGGGGIGIGAYAKHVFGRAEYLLVGAFGDSHFGRPFGDGEVGRDRWGHHAGLFSAGGRLPLPRRVTGEIWGGLMVGPKSARQLPDEPVERRVLLTFLAGINIAYDLLPAKKR
jgi:hypothetical protein